MSCPYLVLVKWASYGEAGCGCPNAVALAVEDGGLVEVAGADEARSRKSGVGRVQVDSCRDCGWERTSGQRMLEICVLTG